MKNLFFWSHGVWLYMLMKFNQFLKIFIKIMGIMSVLFRHAFFDHVLEIFWSEKYAVLLNWFELQKYAFCSSWKPQLTRFVTSVVFKNIVIKLQTLLRFLVDWMEDEWFTLRQEKLRSCCSMILEACLPCLIIYITQTTIFLFSMELLHLN